VTRPVRCAPAFDGDASGLVRAAKQGEQAIDRFGANAAKSFTTRFRESVSQDQRGLLGAGAAAGTVFGSGFLGVLNRPVLGPLLIGALGAAALFAGTAAAGLLVGAFGTGLAALGLVVAARAEAVKTAFSDMVASIAPQMTQISVPFQDTLIQIAGFMERTFDAFKPALEKAFAALSPVITKFADDFFKAMEGFVPTITPITDAFNAMLRDLGPELPNLFAAIAGGITDIANVIKANPDTFTGLVTDLGGLLVVGLKLVAVLAQMNSDLHGTQAILRGEFNAGAIIRTLGLVSGMSRAAAQGLEILKSAYDRLRQAVGLATSKGPVTDLGHRVGGGTFGGYGTFAFAGGGLSRTQPPIVVNSSMSPNFTVEINGVASPHDIQVAIRESEARQAHRANVGRR